MMEAQKQQNQNKILNLVSALDAKFTPDALELAFVNRAIDNELAEIGALHAGDAGTKPESAYVWLGYEICTNSKYLLS